MGEDRGSVVTSEDRRGSRGNSVDMVVDNSIDRFRSELLRVGLRKDLSSSRRVIMLSRCRRLTVAELPLTCRSLLRGETKMVTNFEAVTLMFTTRNINRTKSMAYSFALRALVQRPFFVQILYCKSVTCGSSMSLSSC